MVLVELIQLIHHHLIVSFNFIAHWSIVLFVIFLRLCIKLTTLTIYIHC